MLIVGAFKALIISNLRKGMNGLKICYSKQALKFLQKQDKKTQIRIITAIELIPSGDIKKLQGNEQYYRLRIGDFRVIFSKEGKIISIVKIDNRGQIYRR